MLSVLETNDLLERAEELNRKRDYAGVISLIQPEKPGLLEEQPELLFLYGLALFNLGERSASINLVRRISASSVRGGNSRLYRRCLNLEGILLVAAGNLDQGETLLDTAAAAAALADDQPLLAAATVNQGIAADIRCDWHRATASFERAMAANQRLGNIAGVAGCHHNLGMSLRQLGCTAEADDHFRHALELFLRFGTPLEMIATRSERALVLLYRDDTSLASATAHHALRDARALASLQTEAEVLRVIGIIEAYEGNFNAAQDRLEYALSIAESIDGTVMLQAEILEELAVIASRIGEWERADAYVGSSSRLYHRLGAKVRSSRARSRVLDAAGIHVPQIL